MAVIPAGFCQINHFFGGPSAGTGAQITYGLRQAAGSTPIDVAGAAASALIAEVVPDMSNNIELVETLCKFGPNDTGPSGISGLSSMGTIGSGEGLVPNNAVLVTKNTALGGKRGRGRLFVPGYSEEWVGADGTVVPANLTTLQGDWTGFLVALAGLAAIEEMVLLHAEGESVLPVPTPVTSLIVSALTATQRRRLRR